MLQAHSFLWHYFWLAPHIVQLGLAVLLWRRGLHKIFPIFLAYTIFEALEEFTLYGLDLSPRVSSGTFWNAFCVGLVLEGLLKFLLIGELFRHVANRWGALAKLGNRLISCIGVILAVFATFAAAYTPTDNPQFSIVSRAHILEQTLYIVQCGLIVFLFVFAEHFKLTWDRRAFGIALGLAVVSCEHMAAWAVTASGALLHNRQILDFLNMATYHFSVLIWVYYLLAPGRSAVTSAVPLPENNLAVWNRELERLLQQ